jgi:CheY-like chemotaxis protein
MEQISILVVDDDPGVLTYIAFVLQKEGYIVYKSSDGKGALDIARQRGDEIRLLITDVNMPVLDGVALAREFLKILPHVPVLFISGLQAEDAATVPGIHAYLPKPFSPAQLTRAVRTMIVPKSTGAQGE